MGTIVEPKRRDGSTAFTAQIVVKQNGKTVHREAKTLDRKQAAYAWLESRKRSLRPRAASNGKMMFRFRSGNRPLPGRIRGKHGAH